MSSPTKNLSHTKRSIMMLSKTHNVSQWLLSCLQKTPRNALLGTLAVSIVKTSVGISPDPKCGRRRLLSGPRTWIGMMNTLHQKFPHCPDPDCRDGVDLSTAFWSEYFATLPDGHVLSNVTDTSWTETSREADKFFEYLDQIPTEKLDQVNESLGEVLLRPKVAVHHDPQSPFQKLSQVCNETFVETPPHHKVLDLIFEHEGDKYLRGIDLCVSLDPDNLDIFAVEVQDETELTEETDFPFTINENGELVSEEQHDHDADTGTVIPPKTQCDHNNDVHVPTNTGSNKVPDKDLLPGKEDHSTVTTPDVVDKVNQTRYIPRKQVSELDQAAAKKISSTDVSADLGEIHGKLKPIEETSCPGGKEDPQLDGIDPIMIWSIIIIGSVLLCFIIFFKFHACFGTKRDKEKEELVTLRVKTVKPDNLAELRKKLGPRFYQGPAEENTLAKIRNIFGNDFYVQREVKPVKESMFTRIGKLFERCRSRNQDGNEPLLHRRMLEANVLMQLSTMELVVGAALHILVVAVGYHVYKRCIKCYRKIPQQ